MASTSQSTDSLCESAQVTSYVVQFERITGIRGGKMAIFPPRILPEHVIRAVVSDWTLRLLRRGVEDLRHIADVVTEKCWELFETEWCCECREMKRCRDVTGALVCPVCGG